MRTLLDLRLSRWALLLLVAVSAAATVVIVRDGGQRTPAQTAALVALRQRPPPPAVADDAEAGADSRASARGAGRGTARRPSSASTHATGASSPAAPSPVATAGPSATVTTPPAAASSSNATTTASTTASSSASTPTTDLPKVAHVFEITLSAPSYAAAFGRHSELAYLHSLIAKGTLLSEYHSLGRGELADELALVSGQAPNPETSRGCPTYADFPQSAVANAVGVVHGRGCVYPDSALTIGDQVTASGKVWHAYAADMGKETCVHPNSNATDDVALPDTQPGYDTRHNPFIYFHSLLDLGDCANDDVDLVHLPSALRSAHATPEFDYIAADACADGDPTLVPVTPPMTTPSTSATSTSPMSTTTTTTTTTISTSTAASSTTSTSATTPSTTTSAMTPAGCPANAPAGLIAENAFLRRWIPKILDSPAYRRNGVLVIAVADSGKGAGHSVRTGALVLSRWARRDRSVATISDPYALLRLTEDALGFTPLAHAHAWQGLAARVLNR